MPGDKIVVLKFGSSVLQDEEDLPAAVNETYRWHRDGWRVVAVVSAFAGETDRLLEKAAQICESCTSDAARKLVATAEQAAAALLALALNRAGIPAVSLDAAEIALIATGPSHDADLQSVDRDRISQVLENGDVAVVAGFVARGEDGSTVLLGRGGSDLTALFLAEALGGRCRLIKDVDGIYSSDPACSGTHARRLTSLSCQEAYELGTEVVQPKAIRFAAQRGRSFEVSSPASSFHTVVGDCTSTLIAENEVRKPLRVGLLGLGTVGLGVYRGLVSRPDLFQITGIAVRHPALHYREALAHLLTTDVWSVAESADVVIELIGGTAPATQLISESLLSGKHVVTANKAVIAESGKTLGALSLRSGAQLCFSGAVGGAVPVLEAVERIAAEEEILEITGVLNGTTNFVLDRIAEGQNFNAAISQAQMAGFAEADPTLDIDGSDAASKLILLARAAFGVDIPFHAVERQGIEGLPPATHGKVWRLVARLQRGEQGIQASVHPEMLDAVHPLARVHDEWNRVLIGTASGYHDLRGRGAGRWPTTCAVMADLFDLSRNAVRSCEELTEESGAWALAGGAL